MNDPGTSFSLSSPMENSSQCALCKTEWIAGSLKNVLKETLDKK
jgi:predicted Zn-ribbon and HTH transcriptional regulator